MKALLLAVLLVGGPLIGLAQTASAPDPEDIDELFMKAVMLTQFGLYDEAEEACREILKARPYQKTVKRLLAQIEGNKQATDQGTADAAFRKRLEEMIVPKVDFQNLPARKAIETLRSMSRELSPDKAAINFVWMDGDDSTLPPVTLSLEKVPMLDVIRYVAEAARLNVRVDSHAVVFRQPVAHRVEDP